MCGARPGKFAQATFSDVLVCADYVDRPWLGAKRLAHRAQEAALMRTLVATIVTAVILATAGCERKRPHAVPVVIHLAPEYQFQGFQRNQHGELIPLVSVSARPTEPVPRIRPEVLSNDIWYVNIETVVGGEPRGGAGVFIQDVGLESVIEFPALSVDDFKRTIELRAEAYWTTAGYAWLAKEKAIQGWQIYIPITHETEFDP